VPPVTLQELSTRPEHYFSEIFRTGQTLLHQVHRDWPVPSPPQAGMTEAPVRTLPGLRFCGRQTEWFSAR